MDGEERQDGAGPAAASHQGSPRAATYFFTYLAVLLLDVVVLNVALLFPRHSLAYEWINRFGIFVAVIIVVGLFVSAEWVSTRPMPENPHARFLHWYMRVLGVLLPVLFAIKAWNRILQAFWLR